MILGGDGKRYPQHWQHFLLGMDPSLPRKSESIRRNEIPACAGMTGEGLRCIAGLIFGV